jgi:hypothetical protein
MDLHELAVSYLKEPNQEKNLELAESLYDEVKHLLRSKFAGQVPDSLMEDVLQDSLIAIFEKLETYRGNTEIKFRITAIKMARRGSVKPDPFSGVPFVIFAVFCGHKFSLKERQGSAALRDASRLSG